MRSLSGDASLARNGAHEPGPVSVVRTDWVEAPGLLPVERDVAPPVSGEFVTTISNHTNFDCLTNNAAERALRGFALGRKSWLFAGSDRGADRAAVMATLIVTAKLNDVDPQAWLADVLARIATHPAHRLDELLPWNWTPRASAFAAQAA